MSEIKKEASEHQENQKHHLAQINQQLQAYLLAQHQQLLQMQQGIIDAKPPELPKPSPELSDFLFAQSLLSQQGPAPAPEAEVEKERAVEASPVQVEATAQPTSTDELWNEGYQEVFGKATAANQSPEPADTPSPLADYLELPPEQGTTKIDLAQIAAKSLEINPLKIASAKLPMMLRNRKFGRPSLHAHSQAQQATAPQPTVTQQAA